jgi:outer membrane protein TolC
MAVATTRGVDVINGILTRAFLALLTMTAFAVPPGLAQTPMTMADAMARARSSTPEARALDAEAKEAAARVRQARSGYFPRVEVVEGVQRGNQPVFVFSSLLSQRRFADANFAIAALNHPSAITNVRTGVTVEQPIFDAGLTRLGVRHAEIGEDIAAATRGASSQDLALRAAQAFVHVLQFEAAGRASSGALEAADSDLTRARTRRDVGLVTDADVLAVEVHLADVRQRDITNKAELEVARIQLREAIGARLDEPIALVPPARPVSAPALDALVREAMKVRPERHESELRARLAENGLQMAQAAFLPRVGLDGGWELNGSGFADQRSSWAVGAQVHINVFRGFSDVARVAEARYAEVRATAERESVDRRIEVEIRAALARLEAARAREAAGQATLSQARESHRIVRDRYETGLATVTDVLRAAEATLDAESRATSAAMDVILQTLALDRAVGRL